MSKKPVVPLNFTGLYSIESRADLWFHKSVGYFERHFKNVFSNLTKSVALQLPLSFDRYNVQLRYRYTDILATTRVEIFHKIELEYFCGIELTNVK